MTHASAKAENRSIGVDTGEGIRLFTLSRASLYVAGDQWAAISGLIRGLPGLSRWWLRFLRDGAAKAEPRIGVADRRMLFDKWFEERETQAAESWRIR